MRFLPSTCGAFAAALGVTAAIAVKEPSLSPDLLARSASPLIGTAAVPFFRTAYTSRSRANGGGNRPFCRRSDSQYARTLSALSRRQKLRSSQRGVHNQRRRKLLRAFERPHSSLHYRDRITGESRTREHTTCFCDATYRYPVSYFGLLGDVLHGDAFWEGALPGSHSNGFWTISGCLGTAK